MFSIIGLPHFEAVAGGDVGECDSEERDGCDDEEYVDHECVSPKGESRVVP